MIRITEIVLYYDIQVDHIMKVKQLLPSAVYVFSTNVCIEMMYFPTLTAYNIYT